MEGRLLLEMTWQDFKFLSETIFFIPWDKDTEDILEELEEV